MSFPNHRPRRLRNNEQIRTMVAENRVTVEQLIYPLFVMDGINNADIISAMPGQSHWPKSGITLPINRALKAGIKSFLLFGIPASKDEFGSSAWKDEPVVCAAIKKIKRSHPEAYIITDVCLCAYTDHGHCGIPDKTGYIQNDVSLEYLCKMALAHAKAGADMVAPSDMMDGRVGAIRQYLDENGFSHIPIMAYSAKYSSSFYGPFREAANSAPGSGDRKSYQMNPANSREAMLELELDFEEGADILMVKPGMPYLDVLKAARERFDCPLSVYQVSGEYSMIKAAAEKGWINEKEIVMESMLAFKRAGADLIITYFAPQIAEWLKES